jgi:hypothetical protein
LTKIEYYSTIKLDQTRSKSTKMFQFFSFGKSKNFGSCEKYFFNDRVYGECQADDDIIVQIRDGKDEDRPGRRFIMAKRGSTSAGGKLMAQVLVRRGSTITKTPNPDGAYYDIRFESATLIHLEEGVNLDLLRPISGVYFSDHNSIDPADVAAHEGIGLRGAYLSRTFIGRAQVRCRASAIAGVSAREEYVGLNYRHVNKKPESRKFLINPECLADSCGDTKDQPEGIEAEFVERL